MTRPAPLPSDLVESLESPIAGVRAGVVGELARLADGRHLGLAVAARQRLEQLVDDDSRSVSSAAAAALAGVAAAPPPPPPLPAPPPGAPEPHPPRRRFLRLSIAHRGWILVAAAAVALVVAGVVARLLIGGSGTSTVIPASFDGKWVGTGSTGDTSQAEFTALLAEGLSTGQLQSGNSSCYGGSLKVVEATDSELTMRFSPGGDGCNPWTVVFTHASGSDAALVMSVDPDSSVQYEQEFQIELARRG